MFVRCWAWFGDGDEPGREGYRMGDIGVWTSYFDIVERVLDEVWVTVDLE